MPPSVCAARFCGCTASPASIGRPDVVHLDRAGRAIDRDLGDARGERLVLLHDGDAERACRRACASNPTSRATARSSFCTRGSPSAISMRKSIGSLPSSLAISSRKHSIAKALEKTPTPRSGGEPRTPRLDHVLGEPVRDRVLQHQRSLHDDCDPARAAACRRGSRDSPAPTRRPRDGARPRACRRHRSRPRCAARSSAGTCRSQGRPRGSRSP